MMNDVITEPTTDLRQSSSEKDISIVSSGNDFWRVRIIFPTLESSDLEMIGRLRQAKNLIQITHRVPKELLELREVIDKQVRLMHERDIWARPDNGAADAD